jgi:curli production assembly/transport component CsgG
MKLLTILLAIMLTGCVAPPAKIQQNKPQPIVEPVKRIFPEPSNGKIVVGVYSFTDKTGQRKENGTIAKLSSAVTQGGETLLIKSLQDAGNGNWFRVVERVGLDNLLKERQLIRSAREEARDNTSLRTILYAGMLIEGAIVSYDTNVKTGGAGMRYLGIGPSTQ